MDSAVPAFNIQDLSRCWPRHSLDDMLIPWLRVLVLGVRKRTSKPLSSTMTSDENLDIQGSSDVARQDLFWSTKAKDGGSWVDSLRLLSLRRRQADVLLDSSAVLIC